MSREGILFIVSGPSGVGKGTVLKEVLKRLDDNVTVSVSVTTRKPREGEVNGVHYHFISTEEFIKLKETNGMFEYVEALDCGYGTPRKPVEESIANGRDVILEIETIGAQKVREKTDCVSIFIAPPSASELWRRLTSRGTEDDAQIEKRIEKCRTELPCMYDYDYVVVNEELNVCADEVAGIINAERHKVSKNKDLIAKIIKN